MEHSSASSPLGTSRASAPRDPARVLAKIGGHTDIACGCPMVRHVVPDQRRKLRHQVPEQAQMVRHLATHGAAPGADYQERALPVEEHQGKALAQTAERSAPAVCIPLRDGSAFEITAELLMELAPNWKTADAIAELREARSWCLANLGRRKTQRASAGLCADGSSAHARGHPPTSNRASSHRTSPMKPSISRPAWR